jgi:hypothetical protein
MSHATIEIEGDRLCSFEDEYLFKDYLNLKGWELGEELKWTWGDLTKGRFDFGDAYLLVGPAKDTVVIITEEAHIYQAV